MQLFRILLPLFTIMMISAKAQLSGGFETNSAWYIDDNKIHLEQIEAKNRIRSNSYLRLDYKYQYFTAGIQLESYEPQALLNYSPAFKGMGLSNYYINYRNDSIRLDITAGHFYEQFGSGLVLRSWEDRQLGIANSIAGARIKYSPFETVHFTALYGKQRNGLGFDFTKGDLFGLNAELDLAGMFKSKKMLYGIALSYVNRNENTDNLNGLLPVTSLTSLRGNVTKGEFSFDAEYVFKSADALVEFGKIRPELQFDGDAYLFNAGYSKKGLGINGSFRRLENFGMYSQRNLAGNVYNQGFVNYIPSLTKQYDYSLSNIYVYAAQPNLSFEPDRNKAGEIGGQLDIVYQFKKATSLGGKYGTNLSVNYAQWYGLKGRYDAAQRKYKADLIGFGEKFYQELSFEIRKKWDEKLSSVFMYVNQYYNAKYVEESTGEIHANTAIIENTLKVGKANSVRIELQHQWADAGFNNWAAAQAEFNLRTKWSFFVLDLYNYGNDEVEKKIHYYNIGLAYKYNALRVQASFGRQRGGLICVGGVCRFVSESAGLNLGINLSF